MRRFSAAATIGALATAMAAGSAGAQERIEIDLSERTLYHIEDGDTTRYSVAVGKGYSRGADRRFETPVGEYRVLGMEKDPVWVPPEWRYTEFAAANGLSVRRLPRSGSVSIDDDRQRLQVDATGVYRITDRGIRIKERSDIIVYDGAVWVPPLGNPQRRVPEAMGSRRLRITDDGIYIHGTPNEASLGLAVSHGCVRMANDDVERLYANVDVGTPVVVKP